MKNTINTTQLLNIKRAASFLGFNPGTIRRWALNKILTGTKVGFRGDWRFSREDLLKMVKSNGNKKVEKIL